MANEKTVLMQKKAVSELKEEAKRLKEEFKEYLEDLELFSNPAFWESIEQKESGKIRRFSNIDEMIEELDK